MTSHSLDAVRIEKRAVKARELSLTLPLPPPPEQLVEDGAPSAAWQSWKRDAARSLAAQQARYIDGPVAIAIELGRNHQRKTDGAIRPILDLIADRRHGIIDSDRARVVRSVTAAWTDIDGVRLVIRRYP